MDSFDYTKNTGDEQSGETAAAAEDIAYHLSETDANVLNMKRIRLNFGFYGSVAYLYGLFYTFCIYQNNDGLMLPVLVAVSYGVAILLMRSLDIKVKPGSVYIMVISILISVTTCLSASSWIHGTNRNVTVLLMCVFILHQIYDDLHWNLGKYLSSILRFLWTAFTSCILPFRHFFGFISKRGGKKSQTALYVFAGLAAGVPLMFVVLACLSDADAVFGHLLKTLKYDIFTLDTVSTLIFETVFGTLLLYCFLCSACKRNIEEEIAEKNHGEPIIAITTTGILTLVYLLFCGIQIFYLFLGNGTLPDGMSYSDYAREGFFQLLFVVVLNLMIVLGCLKYFRKSKVLQVILTLISLCTYVMIASAVYRMLLYVETFDLTFLRILVLWFLGVLFLLMIGVLVSIYKKAFPLFAYSLVIVSSCYFAFALAKPDYLVAKYNITHNENITWSDTSYLRSDLSDDALPALAELAKAKRLSGEEQEYLLNYLAANHDSYPYMTWRTYNFAHAAERKIGNEFKH